jgi:hypothetical protein
MKRLLIVFILLALNWTAFAQAQKWSEEKANDWYSHQPWLVGSNYIPAYADNQLEMWQSDTFDPDRINLELGWAESLGMNTMRVFLHDLLWRQDPSGFRRRIDKFLSVAKRHHIKPIFVIFDSCWDPYPAVGIQQRPRPGVHNSRWVQSPGAAALKDPTQYDRVLEYATNVVLAFADDDRILGWDVWNEPDNTNASSYGRTEPPNKVALVQALLPRAFAYVRAGRPTQPVTSGLWEGDWSSPDKLSAIEKIQIDQSDFLSFHNYGKPGDFEKRIQWLQQYHRPILCTEYMARPEGSTFQGILPVAKKYGVAAYNWGLVAGRTQTWLPWDSWLHPYVDRQPAIWFHEIFQTNGKPYSETEVAFIREIVAQEQKAKAHATGR